MSAIQAVSSCPRVCVKSTYHILGSSSHCQIHGLPSLPCVPISYVRQIAAGSLKLTINRPPHGRSPPVCLFGGQGKSNGGGQKNPWKAFENTIKNIGKKESVEDLLRQQIEKKEFFDGGSGGSPPGGAGGGGDGDGGDFGGTGDEGFGDILDETVQVVLATLGFIFLYIYIINGQDISVLVKDVIKYLFGGKKSVRLTRAIYQWGGFFKRVKQKKKKDPYWLERAIISTPTWWDSPQMYRLRVKYYLETKGYSEEQAERQLSYWL